MAKGKNGFDCVLHDKLKKPPRPPLGNTHDQCKEEYVDEQYGQFAAKKQSVQSHFIPN